MPTILHLHYTQQDCVLNTLHLISLREDCKDPSYDGTTLVLICTVLLQERAGAALTHRINKSWELKIKDAIQGADGWTRYRVARAALRLEI